MTKFCEGKAGSKKFIDKAGEKRREAKAKDNKCARGTVIGF
jgi:hypothetical protein